MVFNYAGVRDHDRQGHMDPLSLFPLGGDLEVLIIFLKDRQIVFQFENNGVVTA